MSLSDLTSSQDTPGAGAGYLRGWRLALLMVALFLVSLISQIDRVLPFIMAEMIKAELDLSDAQIGLLTGVAFAVCYTLFSLPFARMADRGSPRMLLVACIIAWSVMTAFGAFAAGFVVLAISRLGVATGEAAGTPASHAIVSRLVSPDQRGLAIGLLAMGIPLGSMAAFAGGGALAETLGWRTTLMGAGLLGGGVALLVLLAVRPTPPRARTGTSQTPFWRTSLNLLSSRAFSALFLGAVVSGFAAAPFYAFGTPFLIRTYGLSASEAGLAFGLLQGVLGIGGALVGGRLFDRAVRSGSGHVLGPPALLFLLASVTTAGAFFAPNAALCLLLIAPAMLAFAFMLPWGFGAAHLVAGAGKEAMATSLVMLGSGLFGPAFGPLIVGLVSDAASQAQAPNALGLGLLVVPLACSLTGGAFLVANHRVARFLNARRADQGQTLLTHTPLP